MSIPGLYYLHKQAFLGTHQFSYTSNFLTLGFENSDKGDNGVVTGNLAGTIPLLVLLNFVTVAAHEK